MTKFINEIPKTAVVESGIEDKNQTYLELLNEELGELTLIDKVLLRIPLIGPWLGYLAYERETKIHLKIWERRLRDLTRRGGQKEAARKVLEKWRSL